MDINSSISSINANQSLLNSSAHNIANSNTQGFRRIETTIIEDSKNSVKAIDEKTTTKNIHSNTDFTKEITNQILSYDAIGANSVALKTQDEVAGTILDIKA